MAKLLHGKETGYQGAEKRALAGPHLVHRRQARQQKAVPEDELKEAVQHIEHMKAAVRSKVEHPLRVVKRQFGYQKVRFKGLFKNTAQVLTPFALSNLWMARRTLLASAWEVRL